MSSCVCACVCVSHVLGGIRTIAPAEFKPIIFNSLTSEPESMPRFFLLPSLFNVQRDPEACVSLCVCVCVCALLRVCIV